MKLCQLIWYINNVSHLERPMSHVIIIQMLIKVSMLDPIFIACSSYIFFCQWPPPPSFIQFIFLIKAPLIERYVAWYGSKNGFYIYIYIYKENKRIQNNKIMESCAQNIITIILFKPI